MPLLWSLGLFGVSVYRHHAPTVFRRNQRCTYGLTRALNNSIASFMSGSFSKDSADSVVLAALLRGKSSFATNFTDQSRPLTSLNSVSNCRRSFGLARLIVLFSREWPRRKFRPSHPIGHTTSFNVRKKPFAGIFVRTRSQSF